MTAPDGEVREWCIVELMGRVRLGGLVSEAALFGGHWMRVEVYRGADLEPCMTKLIPPPPGGPVYAVTPVAERLARAVADLGAPQPVSRWDLPPAITASRPEEPDDDRRGDDDPDGVDEPAGWDGNLM